MSPDQLRNRIMARIEQDGAIHASSLDAEIAAFVACQAKTSASFRVAAQLPTTIREYDAWIAARTR
jgi:hypothetical protein